MKCTIPEISWHNRGPVLSVDAHSCVSNTKTTKEKFWRLASGGADAHVLMWHVTVNKAGEATVNCVSDLDRHQRTVNVVRFSPSGEILASGDDESIIILWKQKEGFEVPIVPVDDIVNKEQWTSIKVLRGHIEDVYDLCWSPDSNSLVSGSLDNTIILWNVPKGKKIVMINDYVKGFPQGVTWDPNNKYIATISSDRICRLVDIKMKKTIQKVSKSKLPAPPGNSLEGKIVRLFYDDTFKSFFRRLTYTPDGLLLIVPSGIIESQDSTEKNTNCTVIFSRYNFKEPIAILPSFDEVTNAVRCCPVYFKLRENGPKPIINLQYRIVFAVATDNSVIVYDTQQLSPLAVISNIHYTRLTDITWSLDGKLLIASSSDGYCSIIHFQDEELGEIYEITQNNEERNESKIENSTETKPSSAQNVELDKNITHKVSNENNKEKSSTEKEEVNGKKEETVTEMEVNSDKSHDADETEDFQLILEDTIVEEEKSTVKPTTPKAEKPPTLLSRTPRRVQLITLSSPKRAKSERLLNEDNDL